ncbi:MAG TPA: tRNA (adenosine(37)-N6)-threonylcarbamoyltransferase complex ATPase subunit type 1 TsaE [Clostridiales bacterium]|jgi:tRNA threonylcarbamoyladenosine biosynthesis protein TsaE|nr:tRNA (adenosine(37)-N6)-threonylcarbamoyltransferase complex ATPase subunit type 1 TsaE [Clostridiales bacterium]
MITFYLKNLEETEKLGELISSCSAAGTVICLDGDLGAGKTTLTKFIGKHLNIEETITSPTFSIVKEYEGDLKFYHMDAYRLLSLDEAYEVDVERYIYSDGVFVLEWAEKLKEILPENIVSLTLKSGSDINQREVIMSGKGKIFDCLVRGLKDNDCFRN